MKTTFRTHDQTCFKYTNMTAGGGWTKVPDWVGLGLAGQGWVGLGRVRLCWAELSCIGLDRAGHVWVGLCWLGQG